MPSPTTQTIARHLGLVGTLAAIVVAAALPLVATLDIPAPRQVVRPLSAPRDGCPPFPSYRQTYESLFGYEAFMTAVYLLELGAPAPPPCVLEPSPCSPCWSCSSGCRAGYCAPIVTRASR